jgi:hypothetical protein
MTRIEEPITKNRKKIQNLVLVIIFPLGTLVLLGNIFLTLIAGVTNYLVANTNKKCCCCEIFKCSDELDPDPCIESATTFSNNCWLSCCVIPCFTCCPPAKARFEKKRGLKVESDFISTGEMLDMNVSNLKWWYYSIFKKKKNKE